VLEPELRDEKGDWQHANEHPVHDVPLPFEVLVRHAFSHEV